MRSAVNRNVGQEIRLDGVLGGILYLPQHGLSLEFVVQLLNLQELAILVLVGLRKFGVLFA